jgi:predicted nucleic acid-binding protein
MTIEWPRIALDTNILAYAEGLALTVADDPKVVRARGILAAIPERCTVIPVQVLGELYNVLTRKRRTSADGIAAAVETWRRTSIGVDTTVDLITAAIALAGQHRLAIWDAIILAAAAEARCDYLLSEDMQDGFVWRGVMIVNPFGANVPGTLARLLAP